MKGCVEEGLDPGTTRSAGQQAIRLISVSDAQLMECRSFCPLHSIPFQGFINVSSALCMPNNALIFIFFSFFLSP